MCCERKQQTSQVRLQQNISVNFQKKLPRISLSGIIEDMACDSRIQGKPDLQLPEEKFEYLDHTADVQLHSWGEDLKEAFEQVAVAMFNYMTTDFSTVEMLDEQEIEAEGDDLQSLLFHFLDEWLFIFSAEPFFIPRKVIITEFDLENFRIKSKGYGEPFDISKHPQGTEVKAITYSNMQIYDKEGQHEIFVIIDI